MCNFNEYLSYSFTHTWLLYHMWRNMSIQNRKMSLSAVCCAMPTGNNRLVLTVNANYVIIHYMSVIQNAEKKVGKHMKLSEKKNIFTYKNLFSLFVISSAVITMICLLATKGRANDHIMLNVPEDTFMDFFNSVYDSWFDNPYKDRSVIYPPLSYLLYSFFANIMPEEIVAQGPQVMRTHYSILVYFVIFFAIQLFIISKQISVLFKDNCKSCNIARIALLASSPMLFCYQRGNLILLTLIFLLEFFILKDSEDPKKRELALICLAVAANFKLYPAIFGLVLIREKKFFAALRCAVYGIVLFVVPFAFMGGFDEIITMFKNTQLATGTFDISFGDKVNIGNFIQYIQFKTGWSFLTPIIKYSGIFVTALLIFAFFTVKKKWQQAAALSLICILLPGFSWMYALIYLIIPISMFLGSETKFNFINISFFSTFLLCFLYYPFDILSALKTLSEPIAQGQYEVGVWNLLSSVALIAMTFLLIFCGIRETVSRLRQKNKAAAI